MGKEGKQQLRRHYSKLVTLKMNQAAARPDTDGEINTALK